MSDQQVQALLTFFQFALLNQVQAEEAAHEAYLRISHLSKSKSVQKNQTPFEVLFVQTTQKVYSNLQKKPWRRKSREVVQSTLSLGEDGSDLSPWRDFFKNATSDEVTILIWALILKLPIEHIATALDLTPGTLQHRLSRGVRKLSLKLALSAPAPVRRPWN